MTTKAALMQHGRMWMGTLALLTGAVLPGCGADTGGDDAQSASRSAVVSIGDTLPGGSTLYANQALVSENGKYQAVMQDDGNFVVYQTQTGAVVWATNRYVLNTVTGWRLTLLATGSLLVTASGGAIQWMSGSGIPLSQQHSASLKLDNFGGLTIRSGSATLPLETRWMSKFQKYEEVAKKFRPAFNLRSDHLCNPLTFRESSSGGSDHERVCRSSFDSGFTVFARVQDHPESRPNSYRITYGVAFGWQRGTAAEFSVPAGLTLAGAHGDDAQYLVVDVVDDRVTSVWADMHQGHYARTGGDRRGLFMYTPNSVTAWMGKYYNTLRLLSDGTTACKNNALDPYISMSSLIQAACLAPCTVSNSCGGLSTILNWGDYIGSDRANQQGKLVMTDHACAASTSASYVSADGVAYNTTELAGLRNYIGCAGATAPWGENAKSTFRSKPQSSDAYALTGCDSGDLDGGDICNGSHFRSGENWKTSKQENNLYLEPYTAGSADPDYTAGTPFNDLHVIKQGDVPWRISFVSGENVNFIQVNRLKTYSSYGRALGPERILSGLIDDPVVAVELCDGDGNSRMRVGHVKVVTRSGRYMEAGDSYDNCRYFQPPGKRLYGFYGRAGDELDVLGPIWGDL